MKNLYNEDGSLSPEAESLLFPKPSDKTLGEWQKILKTYRSQLSQEDLKEFKRLRANAGVRSLYAKNPTKANKWHVDNPDKSKQNTKNWNTKNVERKRAYMTEYAKTRRQKDPLYKFFQSIRSQAVRVVKQVGLGKKPTNTFKWVGCSPEQLKAHIESLFLEGMTWDNYGKYGWHVDHLRPVSSFKPEEWEQINHYTNLQPLWWQDNLSKSNN